MGERTSIGSFDQRLRAEATLEEILSGQRAAYPTQSREESIRQRAKLVLESRETDDIRQDAAFWMGQQNDRRAFNILMRAAQKDRSRKVKEGAVFALSQLPGNEGVEALIKVAKTHPNAGLRKKAIFWLAETGDPRALEVLVEIIKGK
jgi:HEAT repeat protein